MMNTYLVRKKFRGLLDKLVLKSSLYSPLFKKKFLHRIKKTAHTGSNIEAERLRKNLDIEGVIENINSLEQSYYSQNGEDGIIRSLLSIVGTTNRFCVEIGVEPYEGNTLWLDEQGFSCLWIDAQGDGNNIKKHYVTKENVEGLLKRYDTPKTFDLLSIDIDSNDYWIWKAIERYTPRIVVIEYNSAFPPSQSCTVAYDPKLVWDGSNYMGASLLALSNLGKQKGYHLVACDSRGINAFFVRKDLIAALPPSHNIESVYRPPQYGYYSRGRYKGYRAGDKKMITV